MGSLYSVNSTTGAITTTGPITSTSTTSGFVPPKLTTVQRDAVGTPATGTATVVNYTMLSGAILTVAGHALTEGVNWTAATSNQVTANSLTTAINTLTEVTASDGSGTTTTITITAKVVVGSNALTLMTSDGTNLPVSGATLTGEVDPVTGSEIYNTDTNDHEKYDGTSWKSIGSVSDNNSIILGNSGNSKLLVDTRFTPTIVSLRSPNEVLISVGDPQTLTNHDSFIDLNTDTAQGNKFGGTSQSFYATNTLVTINNGADAALEVDSTTQGFLPPVMTTTQRDAIATPSTGLEIYNTTTNQPEVFNGAIWTSMGGGGGTIPNHAINVTTSTQSPTGTGTYVATGPTLNIAAQSTTNAIQFTISTNYVLTPNSSDHNMALDVTILQDGTTDISTSGSPLAYTNYSNASNTPTGVLPLSFTTIFVPGDTSVHTYGMYVRVDPGEFGGDGTIQIPAAGGASATSIITAVELLS